MVHSDSYPAPFPTLTPPSTVFLRDEVVTVPNQSSICWDITNTAGFCSETRPNQVPELKGPTEMLSGFLEKQPRAGRGGAGGGAAGDAMPAAPLLFRPRRGALRAGLPDASAAAVAALRGVSGPHGERAGRQGGERSGSAGSSSGAAGRSLV